MTLTGTHVAGDAGHVTDHNLIDSALAALPTTYVAIANAAVLDTTAADIQPTVTTGTPVAGAVGKAADAGHQHQIGAHDHSGTNKGGGLQESVNTVATSGATQTIPDPVSAQSISRITLSANCTFTFPTAAAGKSFTLVLVQDGTGSRTVTWPGTVKWAGGTAPTLSAGITKIDALAFACFDGTNWLGFVSGLDMR